MSNIIESKEHGKKVRNTDLWINEKTTSFDVASYILDAYWTEETVSDMIQLFVNTRLEIQEAEFEDGLALQLNSH